MTAATRGVLYIAYGREALSQFSVSLRSLRRVAAGLPVAVVSEHELPAPLRVTSIVRPDMDAGARHYKTQMYSLSPYDHTLFLDADTELRSAPTAGYNMLNYVDLVLAQDVSRNFNDNHWPHLNQEEVAATGAELTTRHIMYYNSGVIFFRRSPRVELMMNAWHSEWQRWHAQDQMALIRAIAQHPVRIAPMRSPWNTHISQEVAFVWHKHRAARRAGAPQ